MEEEKKVKYTRPKIFSGTEEERKAERSKRTTTVVEMELMKQWAKRLDAGESFPDENDPEYIRGILERT